MDSIRKALIDPSWWFTVIVAGLFVSVLAAYLKDALASAFVALRARYKQSKEARNMADNAFVEFLIAHPDILQMHFVRVGMAAQFLFCKSGDQVWGDSVEFMLR
jgi:hypothetical protein